MAFSIKDGMIKRGDNERWKGFLVPSLLWRNKMAKRSKKAHRSQAKLQGYVVVVFADDLEQAREFKSLLEVNDVSAVISEQKEPAIGAKEIAVMVPEDFLDEAHVIIESQQAYDDFYDYALDEEDSANFDDELFEDDF
jgi:hypothetical protein